MAPKPRDVAVGHVEPIKDKKTGKQVESPEGLKWIIRIELPKRGSCKNRPRKYRTVYGSLRKATIEKNRIVAEINRDIVLNTIPNKISVKANNKTFEECILSWLNANRDNDSLARRTWEDYMGIATNHIIPALGHIMLRDMGAGHITMYKELKQKNGQGLNGGKLSPGTVNKHLSLISNVLEDAASPGKGYIAHNPSRLVTRAKGGRNRVTAIVNCLSIKQLNNLLDKLLSLYLFRGGGNDVKEKPETIAVLKNAGFTESEVRSPKALHKFKVTMLYPIVYLGAKTGMRLSELLALRWRNIDFDNKTIRVYESSHYGVKAEHERDAHHINTTKEGRPKNPIDITAMDVKFLNDHRNDQAKKRQKYRGKYTDNDLVFAKNNGAYLRNDTVGSVFSQFAKSVGCPVTFHSLRHTHCTLLLAQRVPVIYVANRLGHLEPSTSTNYYGHPGKADKWNLAEEFEHIMYNECQHDSEEICKAKNIASQLEVIF